MEEKTKVNEMIKPVFKSEIKAEIKGISEIEDNIQEVQSYALDLAKYYENVIFTEENLKEAKIEKADVNKFKKKVSDFRKEITKRWNEPLQKFVDTAKITESILSDTYDTINKQINVYEDEKLTIKNNEVKEYFDELATKEQIDFIDYSRANINVTLTASMKSLKEKVKEFIDKIVEDLNLINTQEYVDEILIEYKKDLNVSKAICDVKDRHIALEKAKEEKENKKEQELTDEVMLEKIDSLTAPKEETVEEQQEEIVAITFTVRGTKEKLREVKQFLENGGYDYE